MCALGSQVLALEQSLLAVNRALTHAQQALSQLVHEYVIFYHEQVGVLRDDWKAQGSQVPLVAISTHLETLGRQVAFLFKLVSLKSAGTKDYLDPALAAIDLLVRENRLLFVTLNIIYINSSLTTNH